MPALRSIAGILGDAFLPDETVVRHRARITFDRLLTLFVTLLAVGLAVGYQVLSRWGHLIFGDEE